MGLDMYLSRKVYIGNKYKEPKDRIKIIIPKTSAGTNTIKSQKITYIEEEAGYWRKANAIHKWFVDNVQDGEDDCKEYYVNHEQMEELLDLCNRVIKASKLIPGQIQNGSQSGPNGLEPIMEDGKLIEDPTTAKELLPTQSGFFFGNTDYNEWYLDDIKETKKILEEALKTPGEYYYSSSW